MSEDIKRQVNEAVSPMLATAIAIYAVYQAYRQAGFSRAQAFQLLRDDRDFARTHDS